MKNAGQAQKIQVGTRVYTNLYARGLGTVYAIHGEQAPESVKVLSGILHCGGRAEFDIVFDCGAKADRLPECILRGVQWTILDEVADADQIAEALAKAAIAKAQAEAIDQEEKTAFAKALERIKTAKEYAHLKQGDDEHSGKLAAANIRIELKRTFKGVKFSVRMTDYGCIRIGWTDGPTEEQVEELTRIYKAGHFNGMEDIYEYSKSPWIKVFGGTQYLFANRSESVEMVARVIDKVFVEYAGNLKGIEKPTAEAFKNGEAWRIYVPHMDTNLQKLIANVLHTIAE